MRNSSVKNIATVLIGLSTAFPVMAATILNWDQANNLTGGAAADLGLAWGSTGTVGNVANFITPGPVMSSSINADYTGQTFGAVHQQYSTLGATPLFAGSGEWIESASTKPGVGSLWLGARGIAGSSNAIASLITFDSTAWDASAAASDTISSMSLNYQYAGDGTVMRFAVNSGGTWYISEANVTGTGNNIGTNLNYTGGNWAALSVATSSSSTLMTGDGLTYNVDGATLDNLQGVGFLYESSALDTARTRQKTSSFAVQTIPEPATLGLIGAFGGALLFIRRRFMI